jgi:hypothetical protein
MAAAHAPEPEKQILIEMVAMYVKLANWADATSLRMVTTLGAPLVQPLVDHALRDGHSPSLRARAGLFDGLASWPRKVSTIPPSFAQERKPRLRDKKPELISF